MTRLSPLALATAMAATSFVPLAAMPASAADAVRVSYRDLDLTTTGGQAVLAKRLRRAANRLCFANQTRALGPLWACRADVLAGIRPSVQLAMKKSAVREAMIESFTATALR